MSEPNLASFIKTIDGPKFLHAIDLKQTCIFLDFDGTLVEFAEHPDDVVLPAHLRDVIANLADATDGALAIVTGRRIEDIDKFFSPLIMPVAGVHGLLRRDGSNVIHQAEFNAHALQQLQAKLQIYVDAHDGLLLELKPGSVALHYRTRPDLGQACETAMHVAIASLSTREKMSADSDSQNGEFFVMHGKMVVEARAAASTKAHAIADFMQESPFTGRMPLFAGDDVTDEDGFVEINQRGGISIKVGEGKTQASQRVPSVSEFRLWLERLALPDSEQAGSRNDLRQA